MLGTAPNGFLMTAKRMRNFRAYAGLQMLKFFEHAPRSLLGRAAP